MIDVATDRMRKEINDGLVELHHCSVAKLPFDDETFNKIYHCNVYYFWDDRVGCCRELLRVLKPGGYMVTAVDLQGVSTAVSMGLLNKENANTDNYMTSLRQSGFTGVRMEKHSVGAKNDTYGAIYTYKPR